MNMKQKKLGIQGTIIAIDENNPLPNYTIVKSIGEGTFGKVHLGIHNLTQEKVAIKVLEKAKILEQDDIERINREIKFLKKLKNINIIKIYEIIETKSNVYFIMEHAPGGELFNYIVSKKKLEEKEASFFFAQIIHALDFIHKHNIVHRDVKPENMLLTENNTIKLIDFGLSNQYNKGGLLKTPCGSPCYAAPEMILGRKYNGANIDVWSCGITLYAMVCGYLPFEDKNNDKLYKKILDCKIEFPKHVGDLSKDMITRLLTVNPAKRITFEEIKLHPFFKLSFNMINKSNLGLYLNKVDNSILDKMAEIGFNKEKIIKEVEANNHNNTTTTYELLLNKYKGAGEVTAKKGISNIDNSKRKTRTDNNQDKKKASSKGKFSSNSHVKKVSKEYISSDKKEKSSKELEEVKEDNKEGNIFKHNHFKSDDKKNMENSKHFSPIELFEMEKSNFILKNSVTGVEPYMIEGLRIFNIRTQQKKKNNKYQNFNSTYAKTFNPTAAKSVSIKKRNVASNSKANKSSKKDNMTFRKEDINSAKENNLNAEKTNNIEEPSINLDPKKRVSNIDRILKSFHEGLNMKVPLTSKAKQPINLNYNLPQEVNNTENNLKTNTHKNKYNIDYYANLSSGNKDDHNSDINNYNDMAVNPNIKEIPEKETHQNFDSQDKEKDINEYLATEIAEKQYESTNAFLNNNTLNKNNTSWEFELKTHPNHVLKHLKDFYMRYNINLKDFGFDSFELTKEKIRIKGAVTQAGHKEPKLLKFKLESGAVNKAFDIITKIKYELELYEADKRDKRNN